MKKTITYQVENRTVHKEVDYIPIRYIIAFFITLFEVMAVIGIVMVMCAYVPYFYLAALATEISCIIRIVASNDNPDYKIPWLLLVIIVPIAGFMLYFLFYSRKLQKRFVKRLDRLSSNTYEQEEDGLLQELYQENPVAAMQARMLCNIADTHLFTDTKQEYFSIGKDIIPGCWKIWKKQRNLFIWNISSSKKGCFGIPF